MDSDLMSYSAYLNSLPAASEGTLAKAIRTHASDVLEVRMVVSAPAKGNWYKRGVGNVKDVGGGYEVRLKNWKDVIKRVGEMTKELWDRRTVYVENIPVRYRSVAGIARFINALLHPITNPCTSVQHVSLPGHHPNAKCKEFALASLQSEDELIHMTKHWPWHTNAPSDSGESEAEEAEEVSEARKFGLRCTSKERWEELGREYVAYREHLLQQVAGTDDQNVIGPEDAGPSRVIGDETHEQMARTDLQSLRDHPQNCLVFIRNVHQSTNKTTLRTLFSTAFATLEDSNGIDYVDYNKGMDACYLRLKSPTHASRIIAHFTSHPTQQSDGLDSTGTPAEETDRVIHAELVTGTREQVYWAKVPEKVRREAVIRLQSGRTPSPQAAPEHPKAAAVSSPTSYPQGCLVFVRNIHPSTNKTALRLLFASAFGEDEDGTDYVDFSKGMDTCHLRLKSPSHATRLVSYFTSHPTVGGNGLGSTDAQQGDKAIEMELVTGKREEVYWGKVPEKVRREAVARAVSGVEVGGDEEGERKRRKRRRK
ncbi:hypothetical protein OE88DRAFT_1666711 [Heliocybe sulcata]|uniref:XRRM domain-containing protein n=1 Tax=Heliocybe sulcata TaxID=5364 RepID=A0A5C3MZJ0_9AGAM|nr:hypothetical protein OE88DRAFT_1666711 [Heliocybe sulcata]